jgi:hypothetical protein
MRTETSESRHAPEERFDLVANSLCSFFISKSYKELVRRVIKELIAPYSPEGHFFCAGEYTVFLI